MRRRELFPLLSGLGFAPAALAAPAEAPRDSSSGGTPSGDTPFDAATVRTLARDLASKPYQPPDTALPDSLKKLTYSDFQTLRFDKNKALWKGNGGKFTVEFFHRGFLFKERVDMFEVADGRARPIRYTSDMFNMSKLNPPPTGDLGFAGFRVHFPLNRPEYFDEICAFLGASYFRALARGQGYGLSARGLAIKTGDASGEEFPLFKRFWLERPGNGSDVLVVHALLDSQSAAASFRFTIRPGAETAMDTEMALYPRVDLAQAGLAPMTSMFFFDANNRAGFDDYRAAVHDSQGLGLMTGKGERIWRSLNNPHTLQISAFGDSSPRGFGLAQRERAFVAYQDLEAVYEKRPTLWVEPIGDWGEGAVTLVEIPSDREVNDNIVSFWRPKDKFIAKGEYFLAYRLHWCWELMDDKALAKVLQARGGLSFDQKLRQFVIDFVGGPLTGRAEAAAPTIDVGTDKGKVQNATLQTIPAAEVPNGTGPNGQVWRLSFQLDTGGEKVIELHARLLDPAQPTATPPKPSQPITETWAYRWTA